MDTNYTFIAHSSSIGRRVTQVSKHKGALEGKERRERERKGKVGKDGQKGEGQTSHKNLLLYEGGVGKGERRRRGQQALPYDEKCCKGTASFPPSPLHTYMTLTREGEH